MSACQSDQGKQSGESMSRQENEDAFKATMQKHLDAVSNRDLATLKSTLSPDGQMQLILPQTEITNTVDEFMKYHEDWFSDTASHWTFDAKILNKVVSDSMGMAITEIVYREPARNGEPYSNRMIVSYDLKKYGSNWYVIKDHASSIEKSTD